VPERAVKRRCLYLLVLGAAVTAAFSTQCNDAVLGERRLCEEGAPGCVTSSDGVDPVTVRADADSGGPRRTCAAVPRPPCAFGVLVEVRDADGCVTDFRCALSCAGGGGRCAVQSECKAPERFVAEPQSECGDAPRGCCLPECPSAMAPPAGFCEAGTPTAVPDANGCITYRCT